MANDYSLTDFEKQDRSKRFFNSLGIKYEFTHFWVAGFGWENTCYCPEDFDRVDLISREGILDHYAQFMAYSESGGSYKLRGHVRKQSKMSELTHFSRTTIFLSFADRIRVLFGAKIFLTVELEPDVPIETMKQKSSCTVERILPNLRNQKGYAHFPTEQPTP